MHKKAKIYVAGHTGLVGSALLRRLAYAGYTNIVVRTFQELDLRNQTAVEKFFAQERPDFVILAAAKVGGILANSTYPAEFLYDNLMISSNVLHAAHSYAVQKLLFLGSSCIYPRLASQPMHESALLTGPLEPTNEPYALAKIAGIKLCQSYHQQYGAQFIACMPTNLYGPGDNFDLLNSHVIPGIMAKMHTAKIRQDNQVTLWGTGNPLREFLYVDDLADACLFLMNEYQDPEIINVGTGQEVTIAQLAVLIQAVVGYQGTVVFDATKPDGTPRKLLDCSRLHALGWRPSTSLYEGLQKAYMWYIHHRDIFLGRNLHEYTKSH